METPENNNKKEEKASEPQPEFQLISPAGGELDIIVSAPCALLPFTLHGFDVDVVKGEFGIMYFYHYFGEDFEIWFSKYLIEQTITIIGKANRPVLEQHMAIENAYKSKWDGIELEGPYFEQYNLSHTPFVNNKAVLQKGNYSTFDCHYKRPRLEKYAAHYPNLEKFLNQVERKQPCSITPEKMFLTKEMKQEIHSILNYGSAPGLADTFYEANVTELLILMLDEVCGIKQRYNQKQIDKTIRARDILIKDFANTPKVVNVAKEVGLNERDLKRCFRQLYGTSMGKYVQDKKMECAKNLFLLPEATHDDIASALGYSEVSNLCIAFKRHFKITASQWKEMSKGKKLSVIQERDYARMLSL
jgi:AraC-like DNA-binding protein